MIDGLKPYAAMKDSGVPRLGKVAEHLGVPPDDTELFSNSWTTIR
jgi:hypothetical protein